MATPRFATVSNDPELDTERLADLEELLDEYVYGAGSTDKTTAELNESRTGDSKFLFIGGYAPFAPVVHKSRFEVPPGCEEPDFWTDTRYDVDDADEFLARLSEFLESPLVIQSVSHIKLRFPAGASQYRVEPSGKITRAHFRNDGTISEEVLEPGEIETDKPGAANESNPVGGL